MKNIVSIIYNRSLRRRATVLALAATLVMGACTKDQEGLVTLRVNTENYLGLGKTYVDDNLYTCWSHGDAVRINGNNYQIVITTVNDQTSCYIDGVTASNNGYWSVYPASIASASTSFSNHTVSGLTLPSEQVYATDDQGRQMVPTVMTAYLGSRSGTIAYHNACIALKIELTNNYSRPLQLGEVTVSDDLAPLNGSFSITQADGTQPALSWTGGTVSDENRQLLLDFGTNGLPLAVNQTVSLFIILPPTDAYDGNKFTIEVMAMDAEDIAQNNAVTVYEFSHTQSSTASGEFERNQLAPINISLDEPHTMVLKGLGTQADPYKIYTDDDLQSMQNLVAKGYDPIGDGLPFASAYYQLMNDINNVTMAGPIGTATNNFTGHFDGSLHTIGNATLSMGLFGYISQGATISDLTVNGAIVNMSGATAGGAICARADKSVIDHCQVTGMLTFTNVESSAAVFMGGIVGDAVANTRDNSYIRNCHDGAAMTVTGTTGHRVGGIAGRLQNSSIYNSYTMMNTATGTTNVISATNAYVGGIVGRMDGDSYVVNCYFGLYDNISSSAGRTADICGDLGSKAQIFQCYYRDKVFATGSFDADNLQGLYPYDPSGSTYLYEVDGTHVGTLLNATASSLSMRPWTVPTSSSVGPWLSW